MPGCKRAADNTPKRRLCDMLDATAGRIPDGLYLRAFKVAKEAREKRELIDKWNHFTQDAAAGRLFLSDVRECIHIASIPGIAEALLGIAEANLQGLQTSPLALPICSSRTPFPAVDLDMRALRILFRDQQKELDEGCESLIDILKELKEAAVPSE